MVFVTEKNLDFVVSNSEIEGLFSFVEKRVNFLFSAQLTRSSQDEEFQHSHQWLKLEGNSRDDINLAKEYIIAVCRPEEQANVILRPDSRTQLSGENGCGCLIDDIEKRSGAYLLLTEAGLIEIRGSSVTVALALSLLEGANVVLNDNISAQVDTDLTVDPSVVRINNNECNLDLHKENISSLGTVGSQQPNFLEGETVSREENSKDSSLEEKECGRIQSKECAETADDRTMTLQKCETVVGSDKMVENQNEKNKKLEESAGNEIVKKSEVRGDEESNECPAIKLTSESLRDYALKLGYSDANITVSLSKLGLAADKNSLVLELLKAQSSVKQLEEGSSSFCVEKPLPQMEDPHCLRPIVIDGSNVAMSHGNQKVFSCRGIGITVDWFLSRNHHDIKVFVPLWRKESPRPDSQIINQEVLTRLEQDELLVWTPSRKINGRRVTCYDDRYIVKHAAQNDGIIVSNDNFRDLQNESHDWKKVIDQRLLMYTFVDDKFMPPDDPLGRHGPTLDEFLKRGYGKLCPYGRKCTYGRRCKFLHPERKADGDLSSQNIEPLEGRYGEVHVSRPQRPLPPCPPEAMAPYCKPLPPTPSEVPPHILSKPLPLPPWDLPANMSQVFPPTLRTNQPVGVGQRRPTSDPLPVFKGLPPDVQAMQEHFQRTRSVPTLEDQACGGPPPGPVGRPMQRRGSLPQACTTPPYPSNHPDIMARGRMAGPGMPHDGGPVNGEWMLPEQMFGRHGYQFPPHYPQTPPVSSQTTGYESRQPCSLPSNPWVLHPYAQQHRPYPPHPQAPCQYSSGNGQYYPTYGRTPYRGQHNGYFRSRAPPMDGAGYEVTDDPTDSDSSHEELRIHAYEKLCELFPDDGEKILKIMDEFSDVSSVEELTQHMLDDD